MADKMYFGIPGNIQTIPYPESGMGFDNAVDAEVTNLVSGGRSVFRTPTAFKTLKLSWKGGTAGLASVIDMYNGQFGQGPFFMNDFTATQNNVLPSRWANSWQLAHQCNGWCKPVVNSLTPTTGSPAVTVPNTNKSVTLTQATSGTVPTSGVLKMRTIRVPGKAYWLAVNGSATPTTVRTNLATNPNAATAVTNFAAVAGTSGVAAVAYNAGAGVAASTTVGGVTGASTGPTGFARVTWSTATTAISGGVSYTQTGLAAATQYTHGYWVKASKNQTLNLSVQYQNSSAVNVGAATVSSNVSALAGSWYLLTVTATSGAAVDRAVLTVSATTGGSNWAIGDTLDADAVLIEASATVGMFFDGATTNTTSAIYAWLGTANASTSTESLKPGIKIRGFRADTNVWEDVMIFATYTGVSTPIVTTANTTYEMLELDFYMPLGSTMTLSGMALSTVDLSTVTPVDWMPRGQGVGALQFTDTAQGSLISTAVDRIGLSLTMTEVQNVESSVL